MFSCPPNFQERMIRTPITESFLLEKLLDVLDIIKTHFPGDELKVICSVATMVRPLKDSHTTSGCVSEDSLEEALAQLQSEGGHVLIHVRAQNVTLLMTNYNNKVNIKAFELSPRNEPVINTLGQL
ncbi:hypothetical protein GB937_001751 [Aspergillus fischeri]|nr:hypothetical protein GB937_001751 [Aspergillus fischeri]